MVHFMALENMSWQVWMFKLLSCTVQTQEEIYMNEPEGLYKSQPNTVIRLNALLYGLTQASLTWGWELEEFMLTLGLSETSTDSGCPFFTGHKIGKIGITLVYVNDGIFLGHDPKLVDGKTCLFGSLGCRDIRRRQEFLGIQINRNCTPHWSNKSICEKYWQHFDMTNSKSPILLSFPIYSTPNQQQLTPNGRPRFQQSRSLTIMLSWNSAQHFIHVIKGSVHG